MDENKKHDESMRKSEDELYYRIEAMIERSMCRQEILAAGIKSDIATLRGELEVLNTRIDNLDKLFAARLDVIKMMLR